MKKPATVGGRFSFLIPATPLKNIGAGDPRGPAVHEREMQKAGDEPRPF
jgi:hypothetical protein